MQIEYTGRHVRITNTYRTLCDEGLQRVSKFLGRVLSAHVTLSSEKHRHQAEIALEVRGNTLVSSAESSSSMEAAIYKAIEKSEAQARRSKQKVEAKKRSPKTQKLTVEEDVLPLDVADGSTAASAPARSRAKASLAKKEAKAAGKGATSVKARAKAAVAVTVHSFPAKSTVIEPHVVRSLDSIAMRPMSLEEAVKEAEFRDREVFVFRNPKAMVCVLHRKRDGKMELIEVP